MHGRHQSFRKTSVSDSNTTDQIENAATPDDLKVIEETNTTKMKAESATAKADSILNAL